MSSLSTAICKEGTLDSPLWLLLTEKIYSIIQKFQLYYM
jgi:hypothetical protein